VNSKLKLSTLILLIACFAAGGCTGPAATEPAETFPLQVTDHLGKVITLEAIPQRLISLAPSNTEILFALGLADKVVAVTDYCVYPPEAQEKPSVGGYTNPDVEQIIALTPDLVLASTTGADTFLTQLEASGLKVISLEANTVAEVLDCIAIVGTATGSAAAADELIADLETRIAAITDIIDALPEDARPKVFYPVWHDPLMSGGAGTIHDELITKAGGINVAASLDGYDGISLELVLQQNPDIMIAGSHGEEASLVLLFCQEDERLAGTTARRNGAIYGISDDPVRKPGPRIAEGLEMIAELIHPELFGD
jgi:iron complex transport system substrate-binding protein